MVSPVGEDVVTRHCEMCFQTRPVIRVMAVVALKFVSDDIHRRVSRPAEISYGRRRYRSREARTRRARVTIGPCLDVKIAFSGDLRGSPERCFEC